MAQEKIVIPVPRPGMDFASMDEAEQFYTKDQIVEIINRYCSTQWGAQKYRQNAADKQKAIKAAYEQAVREGKIKPAV